MGSGTSALQTRAEGFAWPVGPETDPAPRYRRPFGRERRGCGAAGGDQVVGVLLPTRLRQHVPQRRADHLQIGGPTVEATAQDEHGSRIVTAGDDGEPAGAEDCGYGRGALGRAG